MKRYFAAGTALLLILLLAACVGDSSRASVTIGESSKFSKSDINHAVDCVEERFKDFDGCELLKIWYDEEQSDEAVEAYMTNGRGSVNGVEENDVIVLYSNFFVDSSGSDGSLNPDMTYKDWQWILIRDDNSWKVDDFGY